MSHTEKDRNVSTYDHHDKMMEKRAAFQSLADAVDAIRAARRSAVSCTCGPCWIWTRRIEIAVLSSTSSPRHPTNGALSEQISLRRAGRFRSLVG